MNTIRATLSEMGRATTYQTPRVQEAARQASLRGQTRTTRAFNHVGGRIQGQINNRSQG